MSTSPDALHDPLGPGATLPELTRALLWLAVLAGALFVVLFEQGILTGGQPVAHELFHDARHLLGVPCH